jgi:hypothetical protein
MTFFLNKISAFKPTGSNPAHYLEFLGHQLPNIFTFHLKINYLAIIAACNIYTR